MWTDIHKNKIFGYDSKQDFKLIRSKTPIGEKEVTASEFH
jgi:hypothetical protein